MCLATAEDTRTAALTACDAMVPGGGAPDPGCVARCSTCPDDCVAAGGVCRAPCREQAACIGPCNVAEDACIAGCGDCEARCTAPPSDPTQCRVDAEAARATALEACVNSGSTCLGECRGGVRRCLNGCTRTALTCIHEAKKDGKKCKRECTRNRGKLVCKTECVQDRRDAKLACVADFVSCTSSCRP